MHDYKMITKYIDSISYILSYPMNSDLPEFQSNLFGIHHQIEVNIFAPR